MSSDYLEATIAFLQTYWVEILVGLAGTIVGAVISPPITAIYSKSSTFLKALFPLNILLAPLNKNNQKCIVVVSSLTRVSEEHLDSLTNLFFESYSYKK